METTIFIIVFFVLIILNCPISFCMLIASILYILISDINISIVAQNMSYSVFSYTILAIPLYVLAGKLLNETGATERIFNFVLSFIGHVRGGLGHVNIIASIIFSGMSGSAAADAGGLGAVEMKAMVKEGYDPSFSAALTAASATIGPVIPPSVIMVAYAGIAEQSAGKMFIGGIFPGLLMGLTLMLQVYYMSLRGKITHKKRKKENIKIVLTTFKEAFLALMAVVVVLGSIIFGLATPTEAGVIAVVYSLLLGFFWKKFTFKNLYSIFGEALVAACSVSFIIAIAKLVGWVIALAQIPNQLFDFIFSITQNKFIILMFINIILLLWGCIMDPLPILLIAAPVLMPIANSIGVDPVQFGVIMVLNLMIGLITPPVGVTLYVISDLTKIPVEKVAKAAIPFYLPLVISLLVVTYYPPIVTFLPNMLIQ